MTLTGRPSLAASTTVEMTAAAPPMSEVMFSMPAAGLMEIPPVSKVMPLPTSATLRAPRFFDAYVEADETRLA